MSDRTFSRRCGKCGQRAVALATVPYSTQIDHDGRKYSVEIAALSIPQCGNCGNIVLDEAANKKISDAFRYEAGLLTPEQIRQGRESLGFTQKQLAGFLDVGEATLSRWETGAQIQQRSLDKFIRSFFEVPEVRGFLGAEEAAEAKAQRELAANAQAAETHVSALSCQATYVFKSHRKTSGAG